MGCNCGGKSRIAASLNAVKKQTVYQAISTTNAVVGEYDTLVEARSEATKVGGRVKVTSKVIQ